MICKLCGGPVLWQGQITNLTHTECQKCGAHNSQEPEPPSEEALTHEEEMTLQLRGVFAEFARALAAKVMCQMKRGFPVDIKNKEGAQLSWQHVMTIRQHVPRILAFIGIPETDETEKEMTHALHEAFSGCGIVDPDRVSVLCIDERERKPIDVANIIPFNFGESLN